MRVFIILSLLSQFSAFASNNFAQRALKEEGLSLAEITSLEKGEIIKKEHVLNGSVLPEFVYIALVSLSPMEALGVFAAYDHQKNYIPNLIVSTPVKENGPKDVLTYYKLKMPWPLEDSEYVHGAKISKLGNKSLHIRWYKVSSNVAKDAKGFASFLPYKDGKTLFIYHSSIWPSSSWAKILKDVIRKDNFKSFQAILSEFKKIKNSSPEKLQEFMERIKLALENKSAYKKLIQESSSLQLPL